MFLPARVADRLQPRLHPRPKRVFIIADPEAADHVFTLVDYWGHHPFWFADPEESLRAVPELKPDAVVVEVLTGTAGLKFVSRLRTAGLHPDGLVAVVEGIDASQRRMLNWAGYGHIVEEPLFVGLRGVLESTGGWREDGPRSPAGGLHGLVDWARQLRAAVVR